MKFRKLITMMGLLAIVLAVIGVMPTVTRAQSGNLLQNPDLEQPYNRCGSGDTANGWKCWYAEIDKTGDAVSQLQYALKPNFSPETNPSGKHPELIYGGEVSQHIGRQYDPWMGGLQQGVNVPPNSQLRFCAWSRLFASNSGVGSEPSAVDHDGRSRVGIFPNGDGGSNSAGLVWGPAANPHDTWQQVCVTATAGPQGRVTVFTSNDFRGGAAIHLDAWWDNAELVVLGDVPTPAPTAGQTNPQLTNAAPPPPAATAVINAEGALVYTIVAGDTLFGLSFQYNVSLDDLLTLNGLTKDSILSIGQKIIIKAGPGGAPQPTAVSPTAAPEQSTPGASTPVTPTVDTPVPPTAAPTPVAVAATTTKLCVRAFNDANGDGLPTADEGSMAGVQFAVANAQGVQVASYTTDDKPESHCFTDLSAGNYTVAVQPTSGTVATSDKRWSVALTDGSTVDVNFGSRSDANAPASASGEKTQDSSGSNVTSLLAGAGGLILLLVAGVIGAFIIARRRG
jgi:LysM repeat protein